MLIPFNILKVAQACAVLLKEEGTRRMGRLRLLKLLYIADREALKEFGRPITGDRPIAMHNGPVLSETYDLIKGDHSLVPEWGRYFRSVGRDVELVEDPGVGKLSRAEITKLQDVAARLFRVEDSDLVDLTHDFEEWKKNEPPKGGRKAIPLDDLLAAVGLLDQKDRLLQLERTEAAVDKVFGL